MKHVVPWSYQPHVASGYQFGLPSLNVSIIAGSTENKCPRAGHFSSLHRASGLILSFLRLSTMAAGTSPWGQSPPFAVSVLLTQMPLVSSLACESVH